jgi:SAM-dependent methyltransferase
MSVDTARYLDMERSFYFDLVTRSNFENEAFTQADSAEFVVGSYAQHESFDYERWLLGGVQVAADALALEYGCGPGRMLLRLAPRFRRVDGVDISEPVLAVARRRCAGLPAPPQLFLTDGQNVPGELDGVYDVAYSVICLQHICVHAIRHRIFEGLFRALRPGGLLTFQMGYGPGHAGMVDYFANFVDASGTNGAADVGVLHPAELAHDLADVGFRTTAYALTPCGPGDTHGAWIFARAIKPGPAIAAIEVTPEAWDAWGFVPMRRDEMAAARARYLHQTQGMLARLRDLEGEVARLKANVADADQRVRQESAQFAEQRGSLERERDRLEDALTMAQIDREHWRKRAAAAVQDQDGLARRVDVDERQLRRLQVADRRRVGTIISELARSAAADNLRVGVLGAGAHSEWLLRHTPLESIAQLFFFDNDPSRAGGSIRSYPVRPSAEIPGSRLDAIVVSSLAFQDEMVTFLESQPIQGARIVTCYP